MNHCWLLLLATLAAPVVAAVPIATTPVAAGLEPADLARIADLTEPDLTADGRWLAYTVSTANLDEDITQSDVWRVAYDGGTPERLTRTPDSSEWSPRWSPDARSLAFLSDRGFGRGKHADETTQVWSMPAQGGKARRLTALPAGVEDFNWSPDGRQLVVVAWDPERPAAAPEPKNPPPIVTSRYQFKEDGVGYLGARRKHLYLVDIASGKITQLTAGAHDEQLPAWSPDGALIAYVSKRGDDPNRHLNFDIYVIAPAAGAPERQVTTFAGADLDPYWGARPAWSPDSRRIAYLQGGEDRWIYYAPWQLAVVDVASGQASIPAPIDRCFYKPLWSADGNSIFALVEQSRVTQVARIDLASGAVTELSRGAYFGFDLAVSANDRLVVLGGGDLRPFAMSAVETDAPAGLRALGEHNAWLADKRLAPSEDITFSSPDGTVVHGLLVKPLDYVQGQRYPTLVRIHGGPVYQFSHEFMVDWQVYAAQGYAVLAVNPRGSSGRGFDFSRAIHADWGRVDGDDVLAGVDHVVASGIADPQRIGIGGWSYGGILTDFLITRDTRFKAAISGAGAGNMYAMYGNDQYVREYRLELGTPWANREAYDRASAPFLHADRISTPTLFQCAQEDFNVPCLGAEQMYQALRELQVPTQLVIYPGENHGLTVPSYLLDRMQRNLAWYDRFLKTGPDE